MKKLFAVLLNLILVCPVYADISSQDLPPKIAPSTEFYTITQIRPSASPGVLEFEVNSPHAFYKVQGYVALAKLLHEIEVIERIRRHQQGGSFFDGAAASVEATADGLGNLVTHPIQSAKGLGQAAGELGKSVTGIFRKKKEGEKSSFGEKMLGSEKRELAKEFNVDVYTTNPHLDSLLTSMARSRMGGKGAVMIIKILIPVALVASVVMTAGSLNGAADQLVNDSSRIELYQLNRKSLIQMGFEEKEVENFLAQTRFTPREQTYLRFYLEKLQGVGNYQTLFKEIAENKNDWQARRKLYEAQIAAELSKDSFAEITASSEGLRIKQKDGKFLFVTAYDLLEDEGVLRKIKELKSQGEVKLIQGCKISSSFKAKASVPSTEWKLFELDKNESI